MKVRTMNDLLVDMVKDLYNAESQLTKALPKMAKKTNSDELRTAFQTHLEETERQRDRLEEVAEILDITPKGKKCAAMAGIVEEAEEMIADVKDNEVLDAALIAAAQKVEHYEIASYGTACSYAKMLGLDKVANILHEILEEEKATDVKLTGIAENFVNQKAVHA